MKPWKRTTQLGELRPLYIRFNGATAMKPWKSKDGRHIGRVLYKLQWGHGDEAVEELPFTRNSRFSSSCFNGATAMKPWKRARPPDPLQQKT